MYGAIGVIVQYILHKGFLLEYRFGGEYSHGCHVFKLRKAYKGRIFEKTWIVADDLIRNPRLHVIAMTDLRYRMKQVDDAVSQCRLLDYDEAL